MSADLRDAGWLGAVRSRDYLGLIALAMFMLAADAAARIGASARQDLLDRSGIGDFDACRAASQLHLTGRAASVYGQPSLRAAKIMFVQPAGGQYPPYFRQPILSLLPWRLPPQSWPTLATAALPRKQVNAAIGQAGFLATLCFPARCFCWSSGHLSRAPNLPVYQAQLARSVPLVSPLIVAGPMAMVCRATWQLSSSSAIAEAVETTQEQRSFAFPFKKRRSCFL